MKKSIVAICGAALAAVAFAQGPACDGKCCQAPRCPVEQERERPVMLFVFDKTDDAAVETYKQAVVAKIDEAVAKSRESGAPTKLVFITGDRMHGKMGHGRRMCGPRPECGRPGCPAPECPPCVAPVCPPPQGPSPEEAPAPEAPAPVAE